MGNNYNFKFDQNEPGAKQIKKHQDFESLLAAYQEEKEEKASGLVLLPFLKNKRNRVILGGLLAAAASFALLLILNPFQKNISADEWVAIETDYFNQKAFVEAPIPKAEPVFYQQKVQAESGGDYQINAGLKMVVPEFAFMNDRGQQIEGEVDIQYREMHNPLDFFLSGIPMHYDSAGHQYQMESAGMIELYGYYEGEPVQLAPGKKIKIELLSQAKFLKEEDLPSFNIYFLDTVQRTWVYKNIDLALWVAAADNSNTNSIQNKLDALNQGEAELINKVKSQNQAPKEPANFSKAPKDAISIDFKVFENGNVALDAITQQIMAQFPNNIWWVDENQAFDTRALTVNWASAQLREITTESFELTLIHPDNSLKLIIHPVLIGKEIEAAELRHQKALEAYEKAMQKWELEHTEEIQAIKDSVEQERALLKAVLEESAVSENGSSEFRAINSVFEVSSFGIWNCDRLLPRGEHKMVKALKDQNDKLYEKHTAYLIDEGKNTLYRFYAGKRALIKVPESEDLLIWVVDEEEKIAVLKAPQGKQLLLDEALPTLNIELQAEPLNEDQVIRDLLNL